MSSVGELLLQKKTAPVRITKNIQMSLWVELGNVIHDSLHLIFFLPMSKKEVENRSSHGCRTLAGFFINLRKPSEYG